MNFKLINSVWELAHHSSQSHLFPIATCSLEPGNAKPYPAGKELEDGVLPAKSNANYPFPDIIQPRPFSLTPHENLSV